MEGREVLGKPVGKVEVAEMGHPPLKIAVTALAVLAMVALVGWEVLAALVA